jgi:hypothetical protein
LVCNADDALNNAGVASAMASLLDADEFTIGPMSIEPPWRDERTADVEPAMNQNAGNTSQSVQLFE